MLSFNRLLSNRRTKYVLTGPSPNKEEGEGEGGGGGGEGEEKKTSQGGD